MAIPPTKPVNTDVTNFVIDKTLDQKEGKWFAKIGQNDIGEEAVIFYQKKEITLGMKIALMVGTVKNGEDVIKKYFNELNIPNKAILNINNIFSMIENTATQSGKYSYTNTIPKDKTSQDIDRTINITIKTKEYEDRKNKFCEDLLPAYTSGFAASGNKKYDALEIKKAKSELESAFDYLNGRDNPEKKNIYVNLTRLKLRINSYNNKNSTENFSAISNKEIQKIEQNMAVLKPYLETIKKIITTYNSNQKHDSAKINN
jgi:hypothetical protein